MRKILILLLLFASCTSEVDFEKDFIRKNDELKLIVFSILCPEREIVVNLRKMKYLNTKNNSNLTLNELNLFDTLSGASVIIQDLTTKKSVSLIEQIPSIYTTNQKNLNLKAGNSYHLIIKYNNIVLESTCSIPEKKSKIIKTEFTSMQYENRPGITRIPQTRAHIFLNNINNQVTHIFYNKDLKNGILRDSGRFNLKVKQANPYFEFIYEEFFTGKTVYAMDLESSLFNYLEYEKNVSLQLASLSNKPLYAFNGVYEYPNTIKGGYGLFAGAVISDSIKLEFK
jgi:hypothetical protein